MRTAGTNEQDDGTSNGDARDDPAIGPASWWSADSGWRRRREQRLSYECYTRIGCPDGSREAGRSLRYPTGTRRLDARHRGAKRAHRFEYVDVSRRRQPAWARVLF